MTAVKKTVRFALVRPPSEGVERESELQLDVARSPERARRFKEFAARSELRKT